MLVIFLDQCFPPLCSESILCRAREDREMDLVCKTRISTLGRELAFIHLLSLEQLPHLFHKWGDVSSV